MSPRPKELLLTLLLLVNMISTNAKGQEREVLLPNALANCDLQARQQAAAAAARKPIQPIDLLAWPLLLNDLASRQQQEAEQPRRLAAIEQQLQQCRREAEAAATQRMEERRRQEHDYNKGYQRISVEAFVLDGEELAAKGAKVSVNGSYLGTESVGMLFGDTRAVIIATNYPSLGEQPKVPLLVNNSPREFRQRLLACRTNPASAQVGCPITVLGRVTICRFHGELGAGRETPCLNVEDGR